MRRPRRPHDPARTTLPSVHRERAPGSKNLKRLFSGALQKGDLRGQVLTLSQLAVTLLSLWQAAPMGPASAG